MENKATAYLASKHPQVTKVLDWAEARTSQITADIEKEAEAVLGGYDIEQVSGILFVALQETLSDRLRMTKPQLAGAGRGLELWRILVKEFEAPDQPVVQRELQKRWAYPSRCKSAEELQVMLPQWEVWGREIETSKGREVDEDTKICSLDQLIPEDFRRALDDHLELQTYSQRLGYIKRCEKVCSSR